MNVGSIVAAIVIDHFMKIHTHHQRDTHHLILLFLRFDYPKFCGKTIGIKVDFMN